MSNTTNQATSYFLDTDIGGDVDDVGALALLHVLCYRQSARVIAVTHCTGSPYACECIDVINRAYGKPDIPIGMIPQRKYMDDIYFEKYSKPLADNYPHRYKDDTQPQTAIDVMRSSLLSQPDQSVVMIAVGPLTNLAEFVMLDDDRALIASKVKQLFVMGGAFVDEDDMVKRQQAGEWLERIEYNIRVDIQSAITIAERWPTPIVWSPFELGAPIKTGVEWHSMPEDHPVRFAYTLHSPDGRSTWDPPTVWAAVMGAEPFFQLSPIGDVRVEPDGLTVYTPNPAGHSRILLLNQLPAEIARALDGWMTKLQ
ncbi:nucleoside hydrolase [Clostridia bacterium]|nr:nucleoside hydrolase [Clostridia bacterium]